MLPHLHHLAILHFSQLLAILVFLGGQNLPFIVFSSELTKSFFPTLGIKTPVKVILNYPKNWIFYIKLAWLSDFMENSDFFLSTFFFCSRMCRSWLRMRSWPLLFPLTTASELLVSFINRRRRSGRSEEFFGLGKKWKCACLMPCLVFLLHRRRSGMARRISDGPEMKKCAPLFKKLFLTGHNIVFPLVLGFLVKIK